MTPTAGTEPFELRHHRGAGRDQRVLGIQNSARCENLDNTRICSGLFARVVRRSDDQVMNDFSGVVDALSRDLAAMGMG
jgi:hypothetical protein